MTLRPNLCQLIKLRFRRTSRRGGGKNFWRGRGSVHGRGVAGRLVDVVVDVVVGVFVVVGVDVGVFMGVVVVDIVVRVVLFCSSCYC